LNIPHTKNDKWLMDVSTLRCLSSNHNRAKKEKRREKEYRNQSDTTTGKY
jgi:hypothetical protein